MDWQFWGDSLLKISGSLGLVAVLVAVYGDKWRYKLSPPRLSLELSSRNGMAGSIRDPANNMRYLTSALWFHMRVTNQTRWKRVEGVHIILRSIEPTKGNKPFETMWCNAALGWRHDPNPAPKTVGAPAECDLCYILKDPLEVRFSPILKGQAPERFTEPFHIICALQASGIEADSQTRQISICWDGQWSDDPQVLAQQHLVIEDITDKAKARGDFSLREMISVLGVR
jgi:hypothetical protein